MKYQKLLFVMIVIKFFCLKASLTNIQNFCEGKEMITQPEVWNCDECGKFYEDKMKF